MGYVQGEGRKQGTLFSWTFGFAFRRERFGPSPRSLRSFTPPLLSKGQH